MDANTLAVAMLSQVFHGGNAAARLTDALHAARVSGAELVVLPELPCHEWVPAGPEPSDADAEPPGGPRHALQSEAARTAGVALLGGTIVADRATGIRYNTALLFGADGELRHTYRKVHIPQEDGFFEQNHYAGGDEPPECIQDFAVPFGVQICSDLHRPQGCHLLSARGAEAILAPRATETSTYDRWELVLRANALTSCCYVLSVNRPGPERGVDLGGPSVAIAPDGAVIARQDGTGTTVVRLERAAVALAAARYPGYLATPADLYARGWSAAVRD